MLDSIFPDEPGSKMSIRIYIFELYEILITGKLHIRSFYHGLSRVQLGHAHTDAGKHARAI